MKKFVLLVISAFLVIVAVSGLLLNKTQAEPVGSCPVFDEFSIVKHLPDDRKCTVYHRCQQGVPILMPCAPGTWFNAVLEVCDWPADSGCTPADPADP